jgi:hypothetical protein
MHFLTLTRGTRARAATKRNHLKRLSLTIVFLLSVLQLFADTGNCIKYKATLKLKGGQSVTGYIFYATYDSLTFHFTDSDFMKFIHQVMSLPGNDDTLNVFLKIQTLKYPQIQPLAGVTYQYQAATKGDIVKLTKEEIISAHCIDYFPADASDVPKDSAKYFNCSLWRIHTEFTQKEIDLLQKHPVSEYSCSDSSAANEEGYSILCYSPRITKKDLVSICERLKKINEESKHCKEGNNYICYLCEFTKLKSEVSGENIILFSD